MRRRRAARKRKKGNPANAARFAPGRAAEAVDCVGGAGWQNPDNGHLVIETVVALHHDQARCLYRAYQAMVRLMAAGAVEPPGGTRIAAMPVDRATGNRIHAVLDRWRQNRNDRWKQLAGRIGLGTEASTEVDRLPVQFTKVSGTARNGRLFQPLAPETYAVLEDGRVIGRLDAGKPQFDVSRLDDEPQYCAGIGTVRKIDGVPSIMRVLALGKTSREAATRGAAIFEACGMNGNPQLAMKIARITPIDGQMIRTAMEQGLEAAEGESRRIMETGLGLVDHLVQDNEWIDVDAETQEAMVRDEVSQVTVDGNGQPQVWEAEAKANSYWADTVQ